MTTNRTMYSSVLTGSPKYFENSLGSVKPALTSSCGINPSTSIVPYTTKAHVYSNRMPDILPLIVAKNYFNFSEINVYLDTAPKEVTLLS